MYMYLLDSCVCMLILFRTKTTRLLSDFIIYSYTENDKYQKTTWSRCFKPVRWATASCVTERLSLSLCHRFQFLLKLWYTVKKNSSNLVFLSVRKLLTCRTTYIHLYYKSFEHFKLRTHLCARVNPRRHY